MLTKDGTGCATWDWVSTFGDVGKFNGALQVAESPDFSYYIVAGMKEIDNSQTTMVIGKYNAADGALVWEMNHGSDYSNGVESVGFLSDGSFVVGGYTGTEETADKLTFKSGG